jgi:hypothetical protein
MRGGPCKLKEVKPLTLYTLKVPNDSAVNAPDLKHSKYTMKASITTASLKSVTCDCAFYSNYQMICWHLLHLIEKLQIKNLGAFENLQLWREYVGYKSRNHGDKRDTSTYKVRKERRLKSFIEKVTDKHMEKLKALCKEKGINLKMRKIGEGENTDDEEEMKMLNGIVNDREEKARKKRAEKAKILRIEMKKTKAPAL